MKNSEIYNKYTIKSLCDLNKITASEYCTYRNYMYKTTKDYVLGGGEV